MLSPRAGRGGVPSRLAGKTVYNNLTVWYNSIVKRLAVLMLSLVLAFGAAFAMTAPASAESETQYNPEEFVKTLTFTALTDYAVSGRTYAFAEGKKLFVYSEGGLETYAHTAKITSLDAADGVFYYKDEAGATLSLPGKEAATHEFKTIGDGILCGSYLYFVKDGVLKISDTQNEKFETLAGFSNPKKYGDKVYAVKDNGLFVLDGAAADPVDEMVYNVFPENETILKGSTPSALKNDYSLKFVTVKEGAYMTEVNLTDLDGEYLKTGATVTAKEDFTVLLLCYTGNAAIVARGDNSYITKISPAAEIPAAEIRAICYKTPAFAEATVTGSEIYASPYVVKGTSALYPAAGTVVKILHKLEYGGVLGASFYEVEYEVDGQTRIGYVTEGLVTEYLFGENKEPVAVPDPEHSEKSNVTTIVLVLIVILLVLAAAAYLTFAGTSAKRKKKKNSDK